jgi:hypothetical protein
MNLSTSVLRIIHLGIMIRFFSKISVSYCQKKFKKTDLKPREELELQRSNKELVRSNKPFKNSWKHMEQVVDLQRKAGKEQGIIRLLHQQDLIISQMRKWNLKK